MLYILNFLCNRVNPFIALRGGNHFSQEACAEKLHTHNHGKDAEIEQGTARHGYIVVAQILGTNQINGDDEASKESQGTQQAKEVHGAIAEFRDEVDGDQVKIAANEPAQTKFAAPVFAFLVMDHFFTDIGKTIHLGDNGDITMHFAVNLNAFNDVKTISL